MYQLINLWAGQNNRTHAFYSLIRVIFSFFRGKIWFSPLENQVISYIFKQARNTHEFFHNENWYKKSGYIEMRKPGLIHIHFALKLFKYQVVIIFCLLGKKTAACATNKVQIRNKEGFRPTTHLIYQGTWSLLPKKKKSALGQFYPINFKSLHLVLIKKKKKSV